MTLTRTTLAAPILALAASGFARAQQASYCDGILKADSFYSTVSSNGKLSNVEYFMQMRNTGNVARQASVAFVFEKSGHFISRRVSGTQSLAPYQSLRVSLAVDTLQNPSGAGRIPENELKTYVRVTCANVR